MFESITIAQSLIMIGIIFTFLVGSAYLRSPISLITWALLDVSFVGVMSFDLEIEIFWIMSIINALVLGISLLVYTYYR